MKKRRNVADENHEIVLHIHCFMACVSVAVLYLLSQSPAFFIKL